MPCVSNSECCCAVLWCTEEAYRPIVREALKHILIFDVITIVTNYFSADQITTFAGIPEKSGYLDGPASTAQFSGPAGIAFDGLKDSVFVRDSNNHAIREIKAGVVTTVAGNGEEGFADGVGSNARFNYSRGIHIA